MSKLAIEKRVQYGAEKMLDVSCWWGLQLISGHREADGRRAGAGQAAHHCAAREREWEHQDARRPAGTVTRQ